MNQTKVKDFGLSERDFWLVREILRQEFADLEKAVIFGSRAKGNFRPGSDIDMAVWGQLTHEQLLRAKAAFEESVLPYKVDLVIFENIENPDLRAHIERAGKQIL